MLIYNGVVHPMDGPVIPHGYVRMEGGILQEVGPMEVCPAVEQGDLDAAGGTHYPRLCGRPLPPGALRQRRGL